MVKTLLGLTLMWVAILVVYPAGADPAATGGALTRSLAVRIAYGKYGYPGPWWRDGATKPEFEADLGTCRRESTAARSSTSESENEDEEVAYRSFLDCMERNAWTRGYPPPRTLEPPR